LTSRSLGQTWTQTSAPSAAWTSIASSADGSNLLAAGTGVIYSSTNSGLTWAPVDLPTTNWSAVASSADGTKRVATVSSTAFYSINSGETWSQSSLPDVFTAIALSADGDKLAAIGANSGPPLGSIYTSSNLMAVWNAPVFPLGMCFSVACSADGNTVACGQWVGLNLGGAWVQVLVSTNFLTTYSETTIDCLYPCAVALSADGKRVSVADWGGPIFTSSDSGAAFMQGNSPITNWMSVASSADGIKLIAAVGYQPWAWITTPGPIYSSMDSGSTWVSNNAPVANWIAVASSADGCKLVAAINGGGIYTSQSTPAPLLTITPVGGGLLLSWIVPSMNFVLQENPGLEPASWIDVPTTPTLNYTNLNYQVAVPAPVRTMFYRLVSH
jgi:hypothetical protein